MKSNKLKNYGFAHVSDFHPLSLLGRQYTWYGFIEHYISKQLAGIGDSTEHSRPPLLSHEHYTSEHRVTAK
jgi:hypothetical protein